MEDQKVKQVLKVLVSLGLNTESNCALFNTLSLEQILNADPEDLRIVYGLEGQVVEKVKGLIRIINKRSFWEVLKIYNPGLPDDIFILVSTKVRLEDLEFLTPHELGLITKMNATESARTLQLYILWKEGKRG